MQRLLDSLEEEIAEQNAFETPGSSDWAFVLEPTPLLENPPSLLAKEVTASTCYSERCCFPDAERAAADDTDSSMNQHESRSSSSASVTISAPSALSSATTSTNAAAKDAYPDNARVLRPLNAYHYFFLETRERLVHGGQTKYTAKRQEELLGLHWNRDRTKKRLHRKTRAIVEFDNLSGHIASQWKRLPSSRKSFFREIAQRDLERYRRECEQQEEHRQQQQAIDPLVAR